MASRGVIEVPLPNGIEPTAIDLELLKATFQAIVTLRYECMADREECLKRLQSDGWAVNWGLTWVAEARRGEVYEQASGKTVEDALAELYQMTRLNMLSGCP
jgi:hypothetical protein